MCTIRQKPDRLGTGQDGQSDRHCVQTGKSLRTQRTDAGQPEDAHSISGLSEDRLSFCGGL